MSKQIHDESKRRKQVKFRADSELVERFDALVDESDEHDNRADALRTAMSRMLGSSDERDVPRVPPTDDDQLRTAYFALVTIANQDGIIPHDLACGELSTALGKSRAVIEQAVLKRLRSRGYLKHLTNEQGTGRAWKLRGVNR